jgi:amino acid transporter
MGIPSDSGFNPDGQDKPPVLSRVKRLLFGAPRDLSDSRIFHRLAVVAFLAWVGLGADGLSSSCYGPEEAFRTLGEHAYLAVLLALVMTLTVFTISIAYSRVIEHFPQGGGGYIVASTLLGKRAGVVSGSALLVDYVLTITVSIAAAGDAIFSFLPPGWHGLKLPVEVGLIVVLTTLNIRGVKESILVMLPVFLLFVVTHLILIGGGVFAHAGELPAVAQNVQTGFSDGLATLGFGGMLLLFLHAYSLGGGTYTGIEAVSNGLPIMREPRVVTGKRTMMYMAISLAFTASGLIICYLLWQVAPEPGKTMNAILVEKFVQVVPLGHVFVVITLLSEGALLVVAAQAGFVDGPRILANMATDSWMPRRFSSLSDRLTTRNGIVLMGATALVALLYTGGDVRQLVVMYSINVFLTFSMTEIGMCRFWISSRENYRDWMRKISIHVIGLVMCLTIFVVIVFEKFGEGGWVTLLVTGLVVFLCFQIKRHYRTLNTKLAMLYANLADIPPGPTFSTDPIDAKKPVAAVLVGGYSGLGIHTTLAALRTFPNQFKGVLFIAAGVVDSSVMKTPDALEKLREQTRLDLDRYVNLMRTQGMPADCRIAYGTDVVEELEKLCLGAAEHFPHATFFAGQLVFQRERWYQSILHNETAFALQRRLQLAGQTLVIIPARMR